MTNYEANEGRGESDEEFFRRVSNNLNAPNESSVQKPLFQTRVRNDFFARYINRHFSVRKYGSLHEEAHLVSSTFYGFRQAELLAATSPGRRRAIKSSSLRQLGEFIIEQVVSADKELGKTMPGTQEHRDSESKLHTFMFIGGSVELATRMVDSRRN